MILINVSFDWYAGLLEDRFEVCKKNGWTGDADESLFPTFLGYLSELQELEDPDPSVVVDNYVINGEFVYRDEFEADPDLYPEYDSWDDLWDNALFANEKYACMQI